MEECQRPLQFHGKEAHRISSVNRKRMYFFYVVKLTKGSIRRHSYSYAAIHNVSDGAQQGLDW